MYSRAERWPKGKGEAPRRLGLRLMPALASRRPHRVAESQTRARAETPARRATADPPGRTAAPGAAQDGRRPEHGDRR